MEWIHSISSIGDLHMKTEYYVRVSVRSIKRLNEHLPDELKFHGWVTILEYNELDDNSKATVSAKTANGLNF